MAAPPNIASTGFVTAPNPTYSAPMKFPMTKPLFRILVLSGLLSVTLLQTGCVAIAAGAAAGASTVAYLRGELTTPVDKPYGNVVKAVERAIAKLEFAKISTQKDALDTILLARTATDKRVEIRVTKADERTTTVRIRVGVFGDEALSRTILQHIQDAL